MHTETTKERGASRARDIATEEQNAEPTVEKVLQKSDEDPDGESAEDEDETKFVEWDPSGRFGRVRARAAPAKHVHHFLPRPSLIKPQRTAVRIGD